MSDNKQKLIRVYIEALKTTFDEHIETDIDLINGILDLYFKEHKDCDFHLVDAVVQIVSLTPTDTGKTIEKSGFITAPRIKVTKTVKVN